MNGLDSFGDGARVTFGLFDSDADVERSERCLPHWFQPGVAAFITFRTADSLPREVLQMWEREQREWLQARNINLAGVEGLSSIDLPDRSLHQGSSATGTVAGTGIWTTVTVNVSYVSLSLHR